MVRRNDRRRPGLIPALALLMLAVAGRADDGAVQGRLWSTWETFEPDKCASVWLIKRHIDAGAQFRFYPSGSAITEGIPFDTPDAELRRYHNASTFETLLRRYQPAEPALEYLGRLLHDIEVNVWQRKAIDESLLLAQALSVLTDDVPPTVAAERCLDYFDRLVAEHEKAKESNGPAAPEPAFGVAGQR